MVQNITNVIISNLSCKTATLIERLSGTGEFIVTGVRYKLDGIQVVVYHDKGTDSNYAIVEDKIFSTTMPVGVYEKIGQQCYVVDGHTGNYRIGGKEVHVMKNPFYQVPGFLTCMPLNKTDGIILLIDGMEYKWKYEWTADVMVMNVKSDVFYFQGGSVKIPEGEQVSAGEIVEVKVVTQISDKKIPVLQGEFVRKRSSKMKGEIASKYVNLQTAHVFF